LPDPIRIHPILCGLAYAYLLETSHGLFLVDSGSPGQQDRIYTKMKQVGRTDLRMIWITHAHYDHYGSAQALRRLTGAKIGVHPADAKSMCLGRTPLGTAHNHGFFFFLLMPLLNRMNPLPATDPDITLQDGNTLERFGLEASILHTPGHTCLLINNGAAFSGDLLGNLLGPRLQYLVASDWSQLPGSLKRLQAANPKWTYTGHRPKVVSGKTLQKLNSKS
jgi:glyoxylase-like metal-dependent hydrolase (beta-lactamase superfamily II)